MEHDEIVTPVTINGDERNCPYHLEFIVGGSRGNS